MNFKILLILAMTFCSAAAFAQKKKRSRRGDRNSAADSYFAYRTQAAQDQRAQERRSGTEKK